MDWLLYIPALLLIKCLQALPLRIVARIGRAGGALAYRLDARHRRVALRNLEMCLGGEYSQEGLRNIAKENFRRLGENYASAVKTAAMTWDQLKPHLEFEGMERIYPPKSNKSEMRRVVAIGHLRGRGNESGAITESAIAWIVEFKSGKVIRVREYLDPKEALEAVGLRE